MSLSKGADYPNFYQNMEEAQRRLLNTVVMYDGEPYTVLAICNHKQDNIFRVYLYPVEEAASSKVLPGGYVNFIPGTAEQGEYLDNWIKGAGDTKLIRKMMNSPAFNKFRPFPLGMMNRDGKTIYLERGPDRRREQGLVSNLISYTPVSVGQKQTQRWGGRLDGPEFYSCVKASHPTARECLEKLRDPSIENEAAAFDRNFAFVRGPLDSLYLAYKTEVVGRVPDGPYTRVELGRKFKHYKEVVENTNSFDQVTVL